MIRQHDHVGVPSENSTPRSMIKLNSIGVAVSLSMLAATSASAQNSIAICFGGRDGGGNPIPLTPATLVAGAPGAAQANWNNDIGGNTFSGTMSSLVKDDGTATPVTLTYAASDAWNNDTAATSATTPDAIMMRGILKANLGGWAVGRTEQFEFDTVPEGQYDIY